MTQEHTLEATSQALSPSARERAALLARMHQEAQAADLGLAQSFGLSADEFALLCERLGERLPNFAELGVVSVMWSEHCSYKSSRLHLRRLPTTGPQVVQGPGENAGAVAIGDGYCAVFKMESHNHPSFIEPFQGAATGVGGILRDVFTMGARPVASLNSLRLGAPDHPKTAHLLKGVVAGIAHYGNCMGVPTVGGELRFGACFNGNNLVNAFTVGIAKSEGLFFGKAEGVGNDVLYVGSRTGRDGIHGATMASASFSDESEAKLPTVQVGDPFIEKLLLEACLEIFAADVLEGVQDMGAAGLTSSSVEMAARAGNGLDLDLDRIPRRAAGLTPYELLLSESQERMLMVAKPGCAERVIEICEKWDLDVAVVGRVTETGRFICRATPGFDPYRDQAPHEGAESKVVVDLPVDLLTDAAPVYDRPQTPRAPSAESTQAIDFADYGWEHFAADLREQPARANLCSRRWVYEHFDHIVGVGTVAGPGESDAAIVRVLPEREEGAGGPEKHLALAVDCNERFVRIHPRQGAAMSVAECARNIVCAGAKPLGMTDCLNFGNPQVPEVMWEIAQAIDGMGEASRALDVPVVSGNVSLYNETDGESIFPTPSVAVVGVLENPEKRLFIAPTAVGQLLVELGVPSNGSLSGSEWLAARNRLEEARTLDFDLQAEVRLQQLIARANAEGRISAAHDISEGGLWQAALEMLLAAGLGGELTGTAADAEACAREWFSEAPSRVVIAIDSEQVAHLAAMAAESGLACTAIGRTLASETLSLTTPAGSTSVNLRQLAEAREQTLHALTGSHLI